MSDATNDQKSLLREFSRRRVNTFFSGVLFVVFLAVSILERADVSDLIDDGGVAVLAIIGIVIIAARWKKNTPIELRSTNTIIMVFAVIMVLLTLYGLYNESADPTAFGDDPAQLIVSIAFLLNRFIP
jgi:hypothetical protein